ncbi:hypothetical protein LPB140_02160 [Sphingorhabdus lutea]|uniref:DUF885 domain-containing protein n=2 Tax=Sphingorhabdus lutea TaxID=1913578 RepID=A0A1L3JEA3_9SPHN|nr:hypothetical protein LPB140_02160 [Sphingorhabdus lutea]
MEEEDSDKVDAALSALAADYVKLSLEIGTHENGYIDAYYGPAEWKKEAEANPRGKRALIAAVRSLRAQLDIIPAAKNDNLLNQRAKWLDAQLLAAETRLMMMEGVKFSFAEEAERLFGVRPQVKPLASYDAALENVQKLLPGKGDLSIRADNILEQFIVAPDKLKPVFDEAITECRNRTMMNMAIPADEKFDMEYVTEKPWSGYNWYQGKYHSLIQINTDLPIRISRAVDLGCHEGYPGHHVFNALLEDRLAKARGWPEYMVYPLYSPQSLIAEGSANYGIELAFPGQEKRDYEVNILFPMAGLASKNADIFYQLQSAMGALSGARLTIAQQYLDGEIDREQAIILSQKYLLLSRKRAEQSIGFTDIYRSYVLNYGLGLDMVRRHIEANNADGSAASADIKWQRMEAILTQPTLPQDLTN